MSYHSHKITINRISSSFDSEDEETPVEPWYSLLRNLTNDQIQFLHNIFKEKALKQKLTKSTESEGLSKEEFVAAIDETFGCLSKTLGSFVNVILQEVGSIQFRLSCSMTRSTRKRSFS